MAEQDRVAAARETIIEAVLDGVEGRDWSYVGDAAIAAAIETCVRAASRERIEALMERIDVMRAVWNEPPDQTFEEKARQYERLDLAAVAIFAAVDELRGGRRIPP